MIEIQLAPKSLPNPIVTFHAHTVEFFYATSNDGGRSFHVGHIKTFELTTDKKGKYELVLRTKHHTLKHEVDERAVPRVKELIVEVQQAMKSVFL